MGEALSEGRGERRERDIVVESVRLRAVNPDKLGRALDDLNSYVLRSAVAGMRLRNPRITERQLAHEIRKAFV